MLNMNGHGRTEDDDNDDDDNNNNDNNNNKVCVSFLKIC